MNTITANCKECGEELKIELSGHLGNLEIIVDRCNCADDENYEQGRDSGWQAGYDEAEYKYRKETKNGTSNK